jgi:hypothetical protein
MTSTNKQIMVGVLVVILLLLGFAFRRDRGSAKKAFLEGYDSTATSAPRTP